jgi:hypothetical protein
MSTGNQIYNRSGAYFFTFQAVDCEENFTRKVYRVIILDSSQRNYDGLES